MTFKILLSITTLALFSSTCEAGKGKETLQDCMKQVQKDKIKCLKENKKLNKSGLQTKNCDKLAELGESMCKEKHPITHVTYENRKSMQFPQVPLPAPSTPPSKRATISFPEASSSTFLADQQDDKWTLEDSEILTLVYKIEPDGFLNQVADLKQCKQKIHAMAQNISTSPGSASNQADLLRLLNKLCKTTFNHSPSSPSSASSASSFQTPSVFGSSSTYATTSSDSSPRTPDSSFMWTPRASERNSILGNPGLTQTIPAEPTPQTYSAAPPIEIALPSLQEEPIINDSNDSIPPPPPEEDYPGDIDLGVGQQQY